jgi:hypothetical protein
MLMLMVVRIVSVMVSVPMSMAMRMSVVRMTTHCYHAEQIDDQSQSTDQEKLIGVHLRWIQPKLMIYQCSSDCTTLLTGVVWLRI